MLTLQKAKAHPIGKKLVEAKAELYSPKHSFLSIYLLNEIADPESVWRPYLDILPKTLDNFPVFFRDQVLKLLQGSYFLQQVLQKRQDVKRDYQLICQVAPQFSKFSLKEFTWGRFLAASRIFALTINGVKTDAFIPLADMLNHRLPKQTFWKYSQQRKAFIITSLQAIPRGQQVFDSYGMKCNSRYFLNYGFILPNNDSNEVAVRLFFRQDDPHLEAKRAILREPGPYKSFRLTRSIQEGQFISFAFACKVLVIADRTVLRKLYDSTHAENSDLQVTKD